MTAPFATKPGIHVAGAIALAVPAVLAIVAVSWLTYGLHLKYGGVASDPMATFMSLLLAIGLTSVVVTPFALLSLRVGWPEGFRRRIAPVFVGSVVLVAVSIGGAAGFGTWAHDRSVARAATGCSDVERAAFAELGAVPTNGEMGFGDGDGSCTAILGGNGGSVAEQTALVSSVRAKLPAQGWVPDGPISDAGTAYIRRGITLVVKVIDEGKTTEVRLERHSHSISRSQLSTTANQQNAPVHCGRSHEREPRVRWIGSWSTASCTTTTCCATRASRGSPSTHTAWLANPGAEVGRESDGGHRPSCPRA
jgi:hypothetical protein